MLVALDIFFDSDENDWMLIAFNCLSEWTRGNVTKKSEIDPLPLAPNLNFERLQNWTLSVSLF